VTPGELIRETRSRRGLSRLEADEVSPGIETLDQLLRAMGECLEIGSGAPARAYDPVHRKATAERSPEERLALGISWNRMAGRLAAAGRTARGRA
jgi:hypothetical protein